MRVCAARNRCAAIAGGRTRAWHPAEALPDIPTVGDFMPGYGANGLGHDGKG